LERLAREDKDTVAIPEKQEKGFIGHPALIRLRRVVSVVCAHIAYGYTQLGYFREAVDYYSKAINYARETGARAHKATVLNNLSRALSEMGRQRALRICLDALELRQQLGADAPIGLSHSTLALIHNDQNNADRAWVEAAKAAIFFKRVDDPRGRGLANIQLGEALRRLAAESRYGRALPASQQELYRAAEEALNDALYIFLKEIPTEEEKTQGKVREPLRWIEARIEKGCLYRDRLLYAIEQDLPRSRWLSLRSTALGLLNEAAEEAMRTDWPRLELDARVNIAWTYYYADDFNEAEKAIQRSKDLISRIIGQDADLIAPGRPLPTPRTVEAYIYYQLSKLHGLRGRIAIDRFNAWTQHYSNEFESAHPGASNDAVHKAVERELQNNPHDLDRAVDAYQLGIAYAQLYSPRSTALSTLYNKLYAYLKKFNQVELRAFQQLVHQHPLTLRKHDLRFEDLGDLEEFLYESLGLEAANMGRE
jgi:tetratricopeptide (TPR) repeat protein